MLVSGDPVRRSYGSRRLNTSTDVTWTVMAGRKFQVRIVRGKNEYLYGVELKVVSESRVTWTTSVPILVFLGLSVLDLGPMYATDDGRR